MSTRSGKRIHASVGSTIVDKDINLQNVRKTKAQNQKEDAELSVKKRHNYVSYPASEDAASVSSDVAEARKTRKTRRNTLKEHNDHIPVFDNLLLNNDNHSVRKTRRGKKFMELNNTDDVENIQNNENPESTVNLKKIYKKKKNHKKDYIETSDIQDTNNLSKKKKPNKKKKGLISITTNNKETEQIGTSPGDTSVDSFHSAAGSPVNVKRIKHHSQTDLPVNCVKSEIENNIFLTGIKEVDTPVPPKSAVDISIKRKRKSSIKNSTFDKIEIKDIVKENLSSTFNKSPYVKTVANTTLEFSTDKKIKSSIKNSTLDKIATEEANKDNLNAMFDKTDIQTDINSTEDILLRKRKRSSIKNTIVNIETNYQDKGNLNKTFDKSDDISSIFNTTVDDSTRKRSKCSIKNSIFDKMETNEIKDDDNDILTFNHVVAVDSLVNDNSTMVKNTDKHNDVCNNNCEVLHKISNRKRKSSIMNSTFDKIEKDFEDNKIIDANGMFDEGDTDSQISSFENKSLQTKRFLKSNDILNDSEQVISNIEETSTSCIKTKKIDFVYNQDDNIELNSTLDPEKKSDCTNLLLSNSGAMNITFDKSGDNSRISITSDESKTENIINHTPVLIESSIDESVISEKSEYPLTPLKREGTFTKEVPEILMSPKLKIFAENTPVKRKSSPGCTPFPFSKSSQKENTKLNLTQSIEKSLGRSSPMELGSRQTRVMFCSPVDNPAMISQMKGRIIKSNLKGSNKSFVFEDSVSSKVDSGRRKRSLTVGDAETRTKRKRLCDELQHSVNRLSRPRTLSAAAKLPDPGSPSKKFGTPSKAKLECKLSRTKLPNFAALHQKQFAKMESLDECQERKAKRARQLLTPTGSVGLLERISPKGTPPKTAPPAKEPVTKLHTPSKPRVPPLESLNAGYTRFGFKLNMDVNPFSVTGKTESKKETRPNGLARQTTCLALPSLAGATASRRDAAKQAVMKEKSFSEKRDVKRKETRTVIKGVRTNRRFELQMKLRNIIP